MSGALAQENVPGGVWSTNAQGIASPQAGRPALSGGLQQMQMLQAFRQSAGMQQLQAMNPYTPRPAQFLPQALPSFDYAAQFRQQQAQAKEPQPVGGYYGGGSDSPIGADGLGDGSAAAAASAANGDSLGGAVGEAIGDAVGGGGGGGGGGAK